MTKVASVSLGLVFLFATATICPAQPAPEEDAIKEAIRRQANVITLRQKLAQAGEAEMRRELVAAAKLYENCYELVQGIGSGFGIEGETAQTIDGLARVRLELARLAQKRGDFKDADNEVSRVLKVDPQNITALELKRVNDKALAELAGQIPTDAARERVTAAQKERIESKTLVTDGRILLEAGKLNDAEAKLKQAMAIDPENRAAFYYLNLVKEARYGEAERRREQDSRQAIVEIEQDWARPVKRDSLPVPNPYATTNLIYTGKGRQAIVSKLDRIRMDTVLYQKLGLNEVVKNLSEEAKKRDPERKGINFMVDPNAAAAPVGGATVLDPTTGLPIAAAPAEAIDISTVSINIDPPLLDVRLADVMEAIVRVADRPIKYSLEDYAVVFSLRGPETVPLSIRIFKVDPNTFYQGLEGVTAFPVGASQVGGQGGGGGGGGGGFGGGGGGQQGTGIATVPRVEVAGGFSGGGGGIGGGGGGQGGGGQGGGLSFITRTQAMQSVSIAVANFFTTLGVDLASPAALAAGKSVFWNDRSGTLLVRATSQDLDIIEAAIEVLNRVPHQVNIKTKFAEISQNDTKAFGFDWYLGNFLMNNRSIVGSGGTQPQMNAPASAANPLPFFPGTTFGQQNLLPAPSDQLITSGLRNTLNTPAVASFTGILTDPQFRVVMRAMEQRQGADILSSPEVTTVSGRQAQVQVVDIQAIVTGVNQQQGQAGGAQLTPPAGGGVVQQAAPTTFQTPTVQPIPIGPILDVIPYISSDGYTIQMTLIPSLTEFVGYDDPGPFIPQAVTGGGVPLTSVLPLPRFRVRQITTTAVVWDGQTIVLGGLISDNVTRVKDKVPILGDIPLVGKLFRSESSQTQKKNLVVFVTPTIIDPAGNRLHTEEEMPFAQTAFPRQAPADQ